MRYLVFVYVIFSIFLLGTLGYLGYMFLEDRFAVWSDSSSGSIFAVDANTLRQQQINSRFLTIEEDLAFESILPPVSSEDQVKPALALQISPQQKLLTGGDALQVLGELRYKGRRQWVTLHFQIINEQKEIVLDEYESIEAGSRVIFSKRFELGRFVPPGNYVLFANVPQIQELVSSSDTFFVRGLSLAERFPETGHIYINQTTASPKFPQWILLGIIASSSSLLLYLIFRK